MKNELLAITSQTEYIESIIDENPKLSEEVKVIENRCRDIYGRLDDLHHNAVKTKLDLRPLKFFQLIDKILSEMQEDLKAVEVVKTFQPPEPIILADQYYFSQSIQNIIINAVEAMEKTPPGNRRLEITAGAQNRWVVLSVKDNGPGIAAKDINNIFKPFFSSKPSNANWGMGLSICHNIILAHNGKITVNSTPGHGTTFYIVLPRI
jgi:signal transduction histidine kinase